MTSKEVNRNGVCGFELTRINFYLRIIVSVITVRSTVKDRSAGQTVPLMSRGPLAIPLFAHGLIVDAPEWEHVRSISGRSRCPCGIPQEHTSSCDLKDFKTPFEMQAHNSSF